MVCRGGGEGISRLCFFLRIFSSVFFFSFFLSLSFFFLFFFFSCSFGFVLGSTLVGDRGS